MHRIRLLRLKLRLSSPKPNLLRLTEAPSPTPAPSSSERSRRPKSRHVPATMRRDPTKGTENVYPNDGHHAPVGAIMLGYLGAAASQDACLMACGSAPALPLSAAPDRRLINRRS